MAIRKYLQATNGHRTVTIVEEDEAVVVRDHREAATHTAEVRTTQPSRNGHPPIDANRRRRDRGLLTSRQMA
jgi:hypothetical protein